MRRIVVVVAALAILTAGRRADLYDLVDRLYSENPKTRDAARNELIRRGDVTIAPALVDSVFFNTNGRVETVEVLERLLGERHGTAYKSWVEAIGKREDIIPAAGYVAFKAKLLAKVDPAFAGFLREGAPLTIRVEEIVWGGVRKNGIPALDRPKFIDVAAATFMTGDEQVFGVSIDGDVRAYPRRILDWHEMANDVVGGRPVALSYCTLCGAAILYDARASDGRTYTFGSSGLLYRSNKLMYDRETNTLWNQMTGVPVLGALVNRKLAPLQVLPITVTAWKEWRSMHPRTKVLSLDTGHRRDYRPGAAYGEYFASANTMFPLWKKPSDDLEAKAWVFVVNSGGSRKIYPLRDLLKLPLLNDRVAGRDLILITDAASEAVRAYWTGGHRLRREGAKLVDDVSGEPFVIREEALVSPSGTTLPRAAAHRAYWFGAYAFYPGTEVWRLRK